LAYVGTFINLLCRWVWLPPLESVGAMVIGSPQPEGTKLKIFGRRSWGMDWIIVAFHSSNRDCE
jgi:hypothetical protein